jgi:tetratricopeptide (TPR) repeat protein
VPCGNNSRGKTPAARFQSGLASSYEKTATVQGWQGRWEQGFQSYGQALRIREGFALQRPDAAEFQNELAGTYVEAGFHQWQREPEKGLDLLDKACQIREELVRRHPRNLQYRCDLAYSYRRLGEGSRNLRDFARARSAYERAKPIFKQLVRENPSVTDFQYRLAACMSGIGHTNWGLKKLPEAGQSFERAIEILERLVQTDPDTAVFQSDLGLMHHYLGGVRKTAGDMAGALRYFATARERLEPLVRKHPELYVARDTLVQSYQSQGNLLWGSGRPEEARRWYQKEHIFLEELVRDKPAIPYSFASLASLLLNCPHKELRDPGRALLLAQKALDLFPEAYYLWFFRGVAYFRTGNFQAALRDLQAAKQRRPRKRDNSLELFSIAMVHWQLGEKDEARNAYREGVQRIEEYRGDETWMLALRAEAAELLGIKEQPEKRD